MPLLAALPYAPTWCIERLLVLGAGWHGRSSSTQIMEAYLALQAEPSAPPPHPETNPQGHELTGLQGRVAPAWEPDGVVQRRGDRGVGG